MKAITIRQPWASLIAHGIKDIENRTWRCPTKHIGTRVLIHAAVKTASFILVSEGLIIVKSTWH
ncbi:MAG: ASCH domain-containing protein [Lachnospiraceae bacterium]|nr:ASCH domain-containing protein [Lachnospiraceae bacterium]